MPQNKQKILVIKLGALGDFIQALGPMSAIRRHHPEADITLLTTEPFVSLGNSCAYFNHILVDTRPKWTNPRGWINLARKFNNEKYDRVYDLQNNDRTGLYFKLFKKKPEWVGIAKGASHRNPSPERVKGSAFNGHKQTLKLAGINDVEIDRMDWIKGDIARFDLKKPFVLIVPGCSPKRPEKRWPAKYFGIIARTVYGWGFTPVIIGTVSEQNLAEEIIATFPESVSLVGKTSITDIVLLGRHAAACIGNDTGPMHLIAPTGCPSYVLFSQYSDPEKHAPLGENVTTLREPDLENLDPEKVIDQLKVRDFRS